jgi:hypothetical protein
MTSVYWEVEALIISDPCCHMPGPIASLFKFNLELAKEAQIWGIGVEI